MVLSNLKDEQKPFKIKTFKIFKRSKNYTQNGMPSTITEPLAGKKSRLNTNDGKNFRYMLINIMITALFPISGYEFHFHLYFTQTFI